MLHSDPAADLNDSSVVLHVVFGQVSFLFTGDAERPSEQAMLREVADQLPSTILKVGHHGSSTSIVAGVSGRRAAGGGSLLGRRA